MKKRFIAIWLMTVACDQPHEPEGKEQPKQVAQQVVPAEFFTDGANRRWRRVREVTTWATGPIAEPTGAGGEDFARLTDEELADRLRPIALINGWEYEVVEAPLQLARDLKSGALDARAGRSQGSNSARRPVQDEPRQPSANSIGEPTLDGESALDGAEASMKIIGTDTRARVSNNKSFPASTHLSITGAVNGSGTMIGRSTAVTAGHVILKDGQFYPPFTWSLGQDALDTTQGPLVGPITGCYIAVTRKGYRTTGKFTYDYAVIEFSNFYPQTCNLFPGDTTGWLGWSRMSISTIEASGTQYFVYGFPGEKTPWPQLWGRGTTGGADVVGTDEIRYVIDTTAGQSGSGVYVRTSNDRFVVGAHQGFNDPFFGSAYNRARRIDGSYEDLIVNSSARGQQP